MGRLAEMMMAATTKPTATKAMLALEDGTVFKGFCCGARGEAYGELCFNTSLEGYPEVVTDPSYAGQIVAMTYPQIGNYGMCLEDAQAAQPRLRGLVVHDMCRTPSNWRSDVSFPAFLERSGVVAIEGVDTRALVRHVRDAGAMRAVLSTVVLDEERLVAKARESLPLVGANLVAGVSCHEPYAFGTANLAAARAFALSEPVAPRFRIVVLDLGVKRSILESLARSGCEMMVVPWDTAAEEIISLHPDGVFLSNGPGDPGAVDGVPDQVGLLLRARVPLFGICMGHQMLCRAAGARMEKLKFGHHGANQPVVNLLTGRVEITAQNHGFNLAFDNLGPLVPELSGGVTRHPRDLRSWNEIRVAPVVSNERFGRIRLTHVNLNDGSAEGVEFLDARAFSVQYHPEASPGPTDSGYLFVAFMRLMEGRSDYLDIDIAQNRLANWKFHN